MGSNPILSAIKKATITSVNSNFLFFFVKYKSVFFLKNVIISFVPNIIKWQIKIHIRQTPAKF